MNTYINYPQEGAFRVLVLADIQEYKVLSEEYQNILLKLIEETKPRLIVLLGDMIFGPVLITKKSVENVIKSIIGVLEKAQIPFTFVFGNHDLDSVMSPQKQMEIYNASKLCMTPFINDRGCSQAYSLDVISSDKEKLFSLMFFDSGATILTRFGISYKGPGEEANDWAEDFLQKSTVPCFSFQHVPVFSIYKLLEIGDSYTDGSVKGRGMFRNKWLKLMSGAEGVLGESPCPEWMKKDLQFENWCCNDAMKAAVFGHDHKNAFSGVLNGIDILQTPTAGMNCYGTDGMRGVRLLDINRDGTFSSQLKYFSGE